MRFSLTYITLKLKELFRSKIYLGFTAFILLLALCMSLLLPRVDEKSSYTLAILDEYQSELGAQVVAVLERDGGYRLRLCNDRRELEALVLSGEALCGYAFLQDADEQIQNGRYTGLMESFYREKSPAAALCDEAVCGAAFGYLSRSVAARYLERGGFADEQTLRELDDSFAQTMASENMMEIMLLGAEGQQMETDNGRSMIGFLYSVFCSLTVVFAIITAFYTHSIDKPLVFAGQKPALVGLCSFLSYSLSYLVILTAAHLLTAGFRPALLADSRILLQILFTAVAGGVLQLVSRRFVSPSAIPVVLPLLPFAAVLLVAITTL